MAVYLATIALEKNRWTTRQPSYAVSDFLPRLRNDGFDGIELWENHFLLADAQEQRRLADSGIPLIFNTYTRFDEGLTPRLRAVAYICDRATSPIPCTRRFALPCWARWQRLPSWTTSCMILP